MSEKKDISFLLKKFSLNQNAAQFDLIDFCLFVQKYVSKYASEYPELAVYENIGTHDLGKELQKLKEAGEISYVPHQNGNATIAVAHFYVEKLNKFFTAMNEKPSVVFPTRQDLPKDISAKFLEKLELDDDFAESKQNESQYEHICELSFGAGLPTLVFPSSLSTERLLIFSLLKLKDFLDKDETSDYVYKRLLTANPGKNFTIKTFLTNIKIHTGEALASIKDASEIYLLWGQTCTFIIQQFNKKSEKLAEEISLLQGIKIIEFMSTYCRTKAQKKQQKEIALKNLGQAFHKTPYYFTLLEIANFKDSRGIPLLGQYEQADLQEYINKKTTEINEYSLPDLLMFKNENGETFFCATAKVIPLIIFLINQNRKKIRDEVIREWKSNLQEYNDSAAMKNDKDFNIYLKQVVRRVSNNLYSLLNAKFLSALAVDKKIIESQPIEYSRIFPQGRLAPYSTLLILDRAETLRDVKILLPFWYGIPFLYVIISFFRGKRNKKNKKENENATASANESAKSKPQMSIKEKVKTLEEQFLPDGLSTEEAMQRYLGNWNQNLSEVLRNNLTEDINALIRDYVRSLQRNMSASTLTAERIRELAQRIVKTPSLQSIADKNSLQKYCELYILQLLQKFF